MIIGLYDYDLITLKQPLIFNLELMKMSYLIKHKSKNTVQMMREWKDSLFSKIYVEKIIMMVFIQNISSLMKKLNLMVMFFSMDSMRRAI